MSESKVREKATEKLDGFKDRINEAYAAVQSCLDEANDKMAEAVKHAIVCGEWLTEAQIVCKAAKVKWGEWQETNLKISQETANLYMRFYEHSDLINEFVANADTKLSLRELRKLLPKGAARGKAGGRAKQDDTPPPQEPSHATTPTPGGPLNATMGLTEAAEIMGENGVEFSNTVTNPGANGNSDPNLKVDALPVETELLAQAQSIIDLIKANATLQEIVKYISAHDMKLRMAVNE